MTLFGQGDGNFLNMLSVKERSDLLSIAVKRNFAKDESIFCAGDEGDGLYIIHQGEVEITMDSPDDKTLTINIYRAGDIIGEFAALDDYPRSATATAVNATELSFVSSSAFRSLILDEPEIAIKLISVLVYRLRKTSNILWDTNFLDARQRVARKLIEIAAREKHNLHTDQKIAINISQDDLSHLCGITRESVNKVLHQFQDMNVVETKRKKVLILDLPIFQKIAHPGE